MTASLQTADGPVVPDTPLDRERRAAVITACVVGGVGCVGVAVPMVASFGPSEREKAAGGPVDVDISSIPPGQMRVVEWRGKPGGGFYRRPGRDASLENDEDP